MVGIEENDLDCSVLENYDSLNYGLAAAPLQVLSNEQAGQNPPLEFDTGFNGVHDLLPSFCSEGKFHNLPSIGTPIEKSKLTPPQRVLITMLLLVGLSPWVEIMAQAPKLKY